MSCQERAHAHRGASGQAPSPWGCPWSPCQTLVCPAASLGASWVSVAPAGTLIQGVLCADLVLHLLPRLQGPLLAVSPLCPHPQLMRVPLGPLSPSVPKL